MSSVCPTHDDLDSYALGKLPRERCEEIDMHLDECAACQAELETCGNADDTILSRLRESESSEVFLVEAECADLMERVAAIGREPSFITQRQLDEGTEEKSGLGNVGPYRLLAKLGAGGMGTVYKAFHTKLDRVVALKMLPTDRMQDDQAIARFEREMKAVGKLVHPNIVLAHDAGDHDGKHFLVMEYVEGIDLSDLIRRHGPLSLADACEIIRQAATGLQHAHEYGLVHRDIKPSNLMLTVHAGVKILDLGLALLDSHHGEAGRELTSTGQTMGTLDYMAPEQGGDSHEVDNRADIYSLGATLYKLLTGEAIFSGDKYNTPVQKLTALALTTAPPIQDRRTDVPDDLAAVVHKMIAKSRDDRFASAADVAAALEPFVAGHDLVSLFPVSQPVPDRPANRVAANWPSELKVEDSHSTTSLRAEAGEQDTGTHVRKGQSADFAPPRATAASPKPARSMLLWNPPAVIIGGLIAVGLLFALLSTIIYTIRTPQGTVEIQLAAGVDAASIEVAIKQNGNLIQVADAKTGWKIKLEDGKYDLQLQGATDKFRIEKDQITVTREERQVVRIALRSSELAEHNNPSKVRDSEELPQSTGPLKLSLKATLKEHQTTVGSIAFSPDGNMLATAGLSNRTNHTPYVACLWDLKSLKSRVISQGKMYMDFEAVAFSPDGRRVAVGKDDDVVIHNVESGAVESRAVMKNRDVEGVNFLDKAGPILVLSGGAICTVDLQGKILKKYEIEIGKKQGLWALGVSPDKKQFVTGGNYRSTIEFWDVSETKPRAIAKHDHGPGAEDLAYAPDGKTVVSVGFGNKVQVWNAADGRSLNQFPTSRGLRIQTVAFSPDGRWLAFGGNWRENYRSNNVVGRVEIWSADLKQQLAQLDCHDKHYVNDLAFSPDGKQLATAGGDTTVKLWDIH